MIEAEQVRISRRRCDHRMMTNRVSCCGATTLAQRGGPRDAGVVKTQIAFRQIAPNCASAVYFYEQ